MTAVPRDLDHPWAARSLLAAETGDTPRLADDGRRRRKSRPRGGTNWVNAADALAQRLAPEERTLR